MTVVSPRNFGVEEAIHHDLMLLSSQGAWPQVGTAFPLKGMFKFPVRKWVFAKDMVRTSYQLKIIPFLELLLYLLFTQTKQLLRHF